MSSTRCRAGQSQDPPFVSFAVSFLHTSYRGMLTCWHPLAPWPPIIFYIALRFCQGNGGILSVLNQIFVSPLRRSGPHAKADLINACSGHLSCNTRIGKCPPCVSTTSSISLWLSILSGRQERYYESWTGKHCIGWDGWHIQAKPVRKIGVQRSTASFRRF